MQQTVLIAAVRGPDGLPKYGSVKMLLRWYRRCVLLSSFGGAVLWDPRQEGGGSFTGPSIPNQSEFVGNTWHKEMHRIVGSYLRELDAVPHHFQLHFMHGAEILGYKHHNQYIRKFWSEVYSRLVNDMHLRPETEEDMDSRLSDNRESWLARNDVATVD